MEYKKSLSIILSGMLLFSAVDTTVNNMNINAAETGKCSEEQSLLDKKKSDKLDAEEQLKLLLIQSTALGQQFKDYDEWRGSIDNKKSNEKTRLDEWIKYYNKILATPEDKRGKDYEETKGALKKGIEKIKEHITDLSDEIKTLKESGNKINNELTIAKGNYDQLNKKYNDSILPEYDEANKSLIICKYEHRDRPDVCHWCGIPD